MRIICPNCDAQYEVPDDAIPDEGRDVQCSNCGMTWMETPAAAKGTGPALVAQNDAFEEVDEPTEAPAQMPRKGCVYCFGRCGTAQDINHLAACIKEQQRHMRHPISRGQCAAIGSFDVRHKVGHIAFIV